MATRPWALRNQFGPRTALSVTRRVGEEDTAWRDALPLSNEDAALALGDLFQSTLLQRRDQLLLGQSFETSNVGFPVGKRGGYEQGFCHLNRTSRRPEHALSPLVPSDSSRAPIAREFLTYSFQHLISRSPRWPELFGISSSTPSLVVHGAESLRLGRSVAVGYATHCVANYALFSAIFVALLPRDRDPKGNGPLENQY